MANFIRNTQVKAMTSIWTAKQKARELAGRTKEALVNREGQGTLDVAITVLISIVLGALILAGPGQRGQRRLYAGAAQLCPPQLL